MTTDRTSYADRTLVRLIDDLADAHTPDYLEAAIERASSRPQRPSWMFPERWLPMADIASRPAFAPRLPWRTIGVALAVLALVIGAALVYVGSHQTRLPVPFGPAANGLIPYTIDGDIYLGDPVTGKTRLLVGGPGADFLPQTSPDGTKVAFNREVGGGATNVVPVDLYVVNADGSGLVRINQKPIADWRWVSWSPDGSQLALVQRVMFTGAGCAMSFCFVNQLALLDAAGSGKAEHFAAADGLDFVQYRPPDGREILFRAPVEGTYHLLVMNADGTNVRTLAKPATQGDSLDLSGAVYSADGSRIFYNRWTPDASFGEPGCCQLFVMNADGSDQHKFIPNTGDTWDGSAAVSPDGTRVAFWHNLPNRSTHRVTVIRADGTGQPIETGPDLPGTAHWVWSPDSTKILMYPDDGSSASAYLLDPDGGQWTTAPWTSDPDLDWQRTAP